MSWKKLLFIMNENKFFRYLMSSWPRLWYRRQKHICILKLFYEMQRVAFAMQFEKIVFICLLFCVCILLYDVRTAIMILFVGERNVYGGAENFFCCHCISKKIIFSRGGVQKFITVCLFPIKLGQICILKWNWMKI